ncbi:hypothetical protein FHY05_003813, partial [Sphingomonas sp. BK580]|nr:hypothetical protein [Sphingomonas sp. BK580]
MATLAAGRVCVRPISAAQNVYVAYLDLPSSNRGVCKRLCAGDVICRGTVVFAVDMSRR